MTRDTVIALAAAAVTLSKTGMREPLDIYAYSREPYYKFLYLLTLTGQFPRCVELGTFMGVGALHLALGNPHGRVVTIDRDPSEWRVDLAAYGVSNVSREKSETTSYQRPPEIDLLFVDADHTYDAVRADWAHWRNAIRAGGIAVFDDRHWNSDTRAWNEIAAEFGERAVALDDLHWPGFGAVLL